MTTTHSRRAVVAGAAMSLAGAGAAAAPASVGENRVAALVAELNAASDEHGRRYDALEEWRFSMVDRIVAELEASLTWGFLKGDHARLRAVARGRLDREIARGEHPDHRALWEAERDAMAEFRRRQERVSRTIPVTLAEAATLARYAADWTDDNVIETLAAGLEAMLARGA